MHRTFLSTDETPNPEAVSAFGSFSFSHSVKAYIAQQNIAVKATSVVATAERSSIVGRNVKIAAATIRLARRTAGSSRRNVTGVAITKKGSPPIRASVRLLH
jgi:hypothetical protein